MASYLAADRDKATAWGKTQGIPASRVPGYVAGLTPTLLRSDTAVTNHGFKNGEPTPFQSVLQAGTAVLVDEYGVPRARCYCGNPLTPPRPAVGARYTEAAWTGFSPDAITRVEPAASPVTDFTLVTPDTGETFIRPRGTTGAFDQPAAAANPTTEPPVAQPPTTLPPVTQEPAAPPPQAPPRARPAPRPADPPVPVTRRDDEQPTTKNPPPSPPPKQHAPEIVDTSTYAEGQMVHASVSFTDADDDAEQFGFRGAGNSGWGQETHPLSNPSYGRASPGRIDYPFNHACGTDQQYESDISFWIIDSEGNKSNTVKIHLSCD
jgi:hypothetical protein